MLEIGTAKMKVAAKLWLDNKFDAEGSKKAAQAVKTVAPDVVDVSSGVEKDVSPCAAFAGKDAEKITKFVENVRL